MKGLDTQSVVNTDAQSNIPIINTNIANAQQAHDINAAQPNVTVQSEQAQQHITQQVLMIYLNQYNKQEVLHHRLYLANSLLLDMTQQQKMTYNRMRVSNNTSDVNKLLQHKETIETLKGSGKNEE